MCHSSSHKMNPAMPAAAASAAAAAAPADGRGVKLGTIRGPYRPRRPSVLGPCRLDPPGEVESNPSDPLACAHNNDNNTECESQEGRGTGTALGTIPPLILPLSPSWVNTLPPVIDGGRALNSGGSGSGRETPQHLTHVPQRIFFLKILLLLKVYKYLTCPRTSLRREPICFIQILFPKKIPHFTPPKFTWKIWKRNGRKSNGRNW